MSSICHSNTVVCRAKEGSSCIKTQEQIIVIVSGIETPEGTRGSFSVRKFLRALMEVLVHCNLDRF